MQTERSRTKAWVTRAITGVSLFAWLALPGTSAADHVSISGSVGASVEKIEESRATISITWAMNCEGATQNVNWGGNLNLVNRDTGEETYLGGVFSGYGGTSATAARIEKDRYFYATLRMWCGEGGGHGSNTEDFASGAVLIPAKEPDNGGGGGGNGGGGGGGGNSGGPTDPLAAGGCAVELLGTGLADELVGTDAGEVILAFGGDDRVKGGDGHDCLIGDTGNDKLEGQEGYDRLTGSAGNDLLVGGPGKNFYDAGGGKDTVKAKNGKSETVRCGTGRDKASVDASDHVSSCENV